MNTYLYPIDPGVHDSAFGIFVNRKLVAALNTSTCNIEKTVLHPGTIVLEIPRADRNEPRKANDLIDLNGAGHWVAHSIHAASGYRCQLVKAYARSTKGQAGWKGSILKPQHHRHALKKLDPEELKIVLALKPDLLIYVEAACNRIASSKDGRTVTGYKDKIHNTLDMVALGLTHLGRI